MPIGNQPSRDLPEKQPSRPKPKPIPWLHATVMAQLATRMRQAEGAPLESQLPRKKSSPAGEQRVLSSAIDGEYRRVGATNAWHEVRIVGGRWHNAAHVSWGLVHLEMHADQYVAAKDCLYWHQNKCHRDWANGCVMRLDTGSSGEVKGLYWLSEYYELVSGI